jgi:hypothetical protein
MSENLDLVRSQIRTHGAAVLRAGDRNATSLVWYLDRERALTDLGLTQ